MMAEGGSPYHMMLLGIGFNYGFPVVVRGSLTSWELYQVSDQYYCGNPAHNSGNNLIRKEFALYLRRSSTAMSTAMHVQTGRPMLLVVVLSYAAPMLHKRSVCVW